MNSDRTFAQPVGYDAVRLILNGFPTTLLDRARQGYENWNNASCRQGSSDFPVFVEYTPPAARTINVYYESGMNPLDDRQCGRFGGNTIYLYEMARDQNGYSRSCVQPPEALEDTMTHELGHVLGLDHPSSSSCGTHIMAPAGFTASGSYVDRSIQGEECQKVADTNLTPTEVVLEDCDDPDNCGRCIPPDYQGCSPIVLDLDAEGLEFTSLSDGTRFDINSDGVLERVAWTERRRFDAFLARDLNGDGEINSGAELTGNATPTLYGGTFPNGYRVLAEMDFDLGNGNGFLDPGDPFWGDFVIWIDANGNGRSGPRELFPLDILGIGAIATTFSTSDYVDEHGNSTPFVSYGVRTGVWGEVLRFETADVFFVASGRQ